MTKAKRKVYRVTKLTNIGKKNQYAKVIDTSSKTAQDAIDLAGELNETYCTKIYDVSTITV